MLLDWESAVLPVRLSNFEKLNQQAIPQDDSDPSASMTKAPLAKTRKRVVPGEDISTNPSSAVDSVEKSMQAQVSPTGTVSAGSGVREVHSTEESSTRSISAGDSIERTSKSSGKRLLPVKHRQAVGTSHTQPAIFPGQILLGERIQDKPNKVAVFSSQKMPQPFLDR